MKNKGIFISASLSCVDLLHLEEEINSIDDTDISFIHYDVVDGEFNDCFVFGDIILDKIKAITKKPIEVHLGVRDINKYLKPFIRAGADYIAVHYESMENPQAVFNCIRELGALPVLAFQAQTPVPDEFIELAKEVSWILKLTVNPGYAGQTIQLNSIEHIRKMRLLLEKHNMKTSIQADGNININTVPLVSKAGANILTGGTSGLFTKEHTLNENIKLLKDAAVQFV